MPELSEVEISRRQLERWWLDQSVKDVILEDTKLMPAGVFNAIKRTMTSSKPKAFKRRGKVLLIEFAGGEHIMVHYRMTGKIEHTDQQQTKSARLSWQLEDDSWLTFKDRRKLGQVEWCDHDEDPKVQWPLLAKMGPEPHDLKSGDELANRMGKKSRRSLKAALLDQTVLAGVGNIAVSELFWRLRIHPETKVNQLREEDFDALHAEMPIYFDWLTNLQESENLAYLNEGKHVKNPFSAYARPDQECERCKTTSIEQLTVGGRSTYYCPTCQPKRT